VVGVTGAALIYGTMDLPCYGDAGAVIHSHVVPRYIEGSATEFHIPNIVTNVLAGYRGYDTMGETTVILTATLGVMLLLGAGRKPKYKPTAPGKRKQEDRRVTMSHKAQHLVMRDYVILRIVATALVPFIMLFALYVQFHGDFGPGGGFQAGVLLGAGIIVYGLILGLAAMHAVAPPSVVEIGLMVGVLLYAGTGVASIIMGGNFLDYAVLRHDAAHGRHLGILLVEGGVGITVCSAMIWIFYSFAGRRIAREENEERDK
jgi:multicomponent Na+:H+ antiporter subunit B